MVWAQEKIDGRIIAKQMREQAPFKKDEPPPTLADVAIYAVLLAVLLFILRSGAIDYAFAKVELAAIWSAKYIPYANLLAGLIAIGLGAGLYNLRDVKEHAAYAPCEILFGAIVASVGFQNPGLAGLIAFAGGVRIIIDGVKRLESR